MKKNDVSKWTHDMVERRLVGPYGQRPTLTDGARPSKSVASSHESRAGNARDRQSRRGRKGEMGAREHGERRKQDTARCLPLPNSNNPGSSGSSNSAPAVTEEANTGVLKLKEAVTEDELFLPVINVTIPFSVILVPVFYADQDPISAVQA